MAQVRSKPDPRIFIPRSAGRPLGRLRVKIPVASLYREASLSSQVDTQLLYGERFDVYREDGLWVWGQAVSPVSHSPYKGYVGYLRRSALGTVGADINSRVSVLKAPIFVRPDIKSRIRVILPLGAQLVTRPHDMNAGDTALFRQHDAGGYIHCNHMRLNADALPTDFVSIAEQHLGLPYIWGGISTDGLDCSGLVLSALRATGQDAPRDTDQQATALGKFLPLKTIGFKKMTGLKRGDLIFWSGHVGIMQSPRQLIHANAYHMCVASEPLKTAVARIQASSGPVTAIKRLE